MLVANPRFRGLSSLGALSLVAVVMSAALAQGASGVEFDDAMPGPTGSRAGEPLMRTAARAVAHPRASSVTMSNRSGEPVALVLRTGSPGTAGDAELCRALSLAIRDRVTGQIVRTAPATSGRAIRIARLGPTETARYEAELRLRPRDSVRENASHYASLGGSCPVGYAWSFAPVH